MAKVTRAAIHEFLAAKRIAVIGASRDEKTYSGMLFAELLKHGYDAIPVNPSASEIAGRAAYRSVTEIRPAPERALILLPEDKTEQAVIDCADAGIQRVWLHRHVAGGVSDTRAIFRAEERGIQLITGFCMFMFLPRTPFFHKLHGGVLRLVGAYPR
jgi:predicted CoA-binding protein